MATGANSRYSYCPEDDINRLSERHAARGAMISAAGATTFHGTRRSVGVQLWNYIEVQALVRQLDTEAQRSAVLYSVSLLARSNSFPARGSKEGIINHRMYRACIRKIYVPAAGRFTTCKRKHTARPGLGQLIS